MTALQYRIKETICITVQDQRSDCSIVKGVTAVQCRIKGVVAEQSLCSTIHDQRSDCSTVKAVTAIQYRIKGVTALHSLCSSVQDKIVTHE